MARAFALVMAEPENDLIDCEGHGLWLTSSARHEGPTFDSVEAHINSVLEKIEALPPVPPLARTVVTLHMTPVSPSVIKPGDLVGCDEQGHAQVGTGIPIGRALAAAGDHVLVQLDGLGPPVAYNPVAYNPAFDLPLALQHGDGPGRSWFGPLSGHFHHIAPVEFEQLPPQPEVPINVAAATHARVGGVVSINPSTVGYMADALDTLETDLPQSGPS